MTRSQSDEIANTQWILKIREAMETLDGLEMPEGIRKTIWRCLQGEFIEAVDRQYELDVTERDGRKWTEEDDEAVRQYLSDKPIPPSWRDDGSEHWTQERMLAAGLATRLKRGEKNCKKRATALGFRHFSG